MQPGTEKCLCEFLEPMGFSLCDALSHTKLGRSTQNLTLIYYYTQKTLFQTRAKCLSSQDKDDVLKYECWGELVEDQGGCGIVSTRELKKTQAFTDNKALYQRHIHHILFQTACVIVQYHPELGFAHSEVHASNRGRNSWLVHLGQLAVAQVARIKILEGSCLWLLLVWSLDRGYEIWLRFANSGKKWCNTGSYSN